MKGLAMGLIAVRPVFSGWIFLVLAAGLLANAAQAHLALSTPVGRYGPDVLKVGPCGVAGGARSEQVTIFEAGATIDVGWVEYIDHPGHFRIAFDDDGDDDFVDPRCLAECSSRAPIVELYSNETVLLDGVADTRGGDSRISITLPDVECDNCTLQVIQVMYDKPPYVIPGDDIYYQCADLVLRRSASPTPTPGFCVGDCNGDDRVDVSELLRMVRMALGELDLGQCPVADADADGSIGIDDLVAAVMRALNRC